MVDFIALRSLSAERTEEDNDDAANISKLKTRRRKS